MLCSKCNEGQVEIETSVETVNLVDEQNDEYHHQVETSVETVNPVDEQNNDSYHQVETSVETVNHVNEQNDPSLVLSNGAEDFSGSKKIMNSINDAITV